jgi:RND family efflux transporter MFP subunit
MTRTHRTVLVVLAVLVAGASRAAVAAGPVVTSGVVRSDEKVEMKAKQVAPIVRIALAEGDVAKKGQLLVEMDSDVQRAQVDAAKADVGRAEAAVVEAELDVTTTTREYERNRSVADLITERELAMSRDAMQRAVAVLETKRQDVIHARAQLGVADANLADTMIRAPFDGVISRIYLRVGATPKGQEQTLLDFQNLERLYVEVAVPLPYLRSVVEGMPVSVTVEDEHRSITTAVAGTVRYVYPEIDTALRMFRMKVAVPPQQHHVLPGMLAKISFVPR